MAKSIDSITSVKISGSENFPAGYTFSHAISEPIEEQRIHKKIREATEKIQKIKQQKSMNNRSLCK